MYRVGINSIYAEKSLRRGAETREGQAKAKFMLTDMQKDYIASKLPRGYSFVIVSDTDEKRQRIPKKTDEFFETEFVRTDYRRENHDRKYEKKEEKKEEKKTKDKK